MGPGGLLVVVVTETFRRGFWAGPAAIAGHAAVEVAMIFLLNLGLGKVLAYEKVLGAIGLIGGVMLFYFGYGTLKTAKVATLALGTQEGTSSGSPPENGAASEPAGMRPRDASERRDDFRAGLRTKGFAGTAVAGMAASISNPYWIIWWATVGAAYVATSAGYGVAGPATFFVGHIAADLAWYSLVSFAIATGTRFFNDRVYRGILYVCGSFLFLFGAYFLRLGVSNLLR